MNPPDTARKAARPLQDRVILVTGASGGLGYACAFEAAARGATVVLHGRNVSKLEKLYDEIVAAGGAMPAILPMDFATAEDRDYDSLAQAIASQLRRLDGIIHCASLFEHLSPLAMQDAAEWQVLYRVNCIAPFAIDRACTPLLKQSGNAAVVLIGASAGQHPAAYWGGFAAAKAALAAYFQVQAEEWDKPPHPRIHLFIPGPIHSPQRARSHPGEGKSALPTVTAAAQAIVALLEPENPAPRGSRIDWDGHAA